jgi:hypothetical protein
MICQSLKLGALFSIGIFAIAYGVMFGATVEATECPKCIWIECGEQIREKNGSLTQRYHIRNSDNSCLDCTHSSYLQALYRFHCRSASSKKPYRFDRSFPKAGYWQAVITCDNGELYLDINSRTDTRIELYVFGTRGRKKLLAHISHFLFGKASPSDETRAHGPVAQLPADLPRLCLHPSCRNYYMQTGQTYQFTYTCKSTMAKTMSILENQKHLTEVAVSPKGTFDYMPPHDRQLDRAGPHEFKETVALIEETTAEWDYASTCTLLLNRSYLGHLRRLPGHILFGVTILAFVGGVGCKRRHRRN